MLVGYARVSTQDQNTALQVDALRGAGASRIFEDQKSAVLVRPGLARALYSLRAGDVFVVYKVDRVARSLSDLLRIVERVNVSGAVFRSLTEPIDTGTPVGRMMLQLLGAFAEFERSVIRERAAAGLAAARRRGVRCGRPRKIDVDALPLLRAQGFNARQIAERFGVDTSSVTVWLLKLGINPRGGVSRSKKLPRYKTENPPVGGSSGAVPASASHVG